MKRRLKQRQKNGKRYLFLLACATAWRRLDYRFIILLRPLILQVHISKSHITHIRDSHLCRRFKTLPVKEQKKKNVERDRQINDDFYITV